MHFCFIYAIGILFSLLAGFAGFWFCTIRTRSPLLYSSNFYKNLVLVLMVSYVIIFSILKDLTVLSHHSYLDYAVFLEYFFKLSRGNGLNSSIQGAAIPGAAHWFANHFTPLAYVYGALFKIWPSFQLINWLQTSMLASSAIILFCFAQRNLGRFSAGCFAAALLFNPSFQYITLYEFEFLRFILPIGLVCLGVILTKDKTSWYVVIFACIMCLLVREDAAFFVAGIGMYLCLSSKTRWLGVAVVILAVLYLILMLKVVMPSFRTSGPSGHIAASWFESFGRTPWEIFGNILHNPLAFAKHIFHPYKSVNYVMLLVPFSFVALLAPRVLLILVPPLGFLAMSGAYTHTSYMLYYIGPVFVVIVWATVFGTASLSGWLEKNRKFLIRKIPFLYPATQDRIAFAILCSSIVCSIYFGPSPLSIQFWCKNFTVAPFRTTTFHVSRYHPTKHDEYVREIAKMIPNSASVSAEMALLNDVYQCRILYTFPWIEGAEYILLDKKNPRKTGIGTIPGSWDGIRLNPQFYYDWVEKRKDVYELIAEKNGVYLYRRKKDAVPYAQPMSAPNLDRMN